jgi:hypothetical protein
MKPTVFLISICFTTGIVAQADDALEWERAKKELELMEKRMDQPNVQYLNKVAPASKPRARINVPTKSNRSPASIKVSYVKPNVQTEDPQILGLKQKIQKNSVEIEAAKKFLDSAYAQRVVPVVGMLANISAQMAEREMKGQKIPQEELAKKAETERKLEEYKSMLKPTAEKVKKLEEEQKTLRTMLTQFILVAN